MKDKNETSTLLHTRSSCLFFDEAKRQSSGTRHDNTQAFNKIITERVWHMKKWLLLLVASMMFVVAGCGDKDEDKEEDPVEEEDENAEDEEENEDENGEGEEGNDPAEIGEVDQAIADEALAVLEENNNYANAQDIDGYLKAIPESMQEQMRQTLQQTFSQGQIEFEIVDYQYESANENEVVISVLQTTVAKEEIPGFEDNISELMHTLQPENGEWKIFNTQVLNSEPYGEEGGVEGGAQGEGGTEAPADIDEGAAEEALNVLYENIDYANNKDVDGYLKAIPEDQHASARGSVEQMFNAGDLEFDILEYEVLSADQGRVEIAIVQTTVSKTPIEGFENNIAEMLHTLENVNGEWKIISSDVLKQEPYEG